MTKNKFEFFRKFNGFLILFFCFIISFAQKNKIQYDGSIIRFHIYGKGEPVFVLGGGPGNNCMQQEDVAIKLSEQYQAILLEQRGTGLSMPKELNNSTINLAAYLQDIIYVMDSLKIKKAKFYGFSWGGPYSLAFAIENPDRVTSLVLVAPGFLKFSKRDNKKLYLNRIAKLNDVDRRKYNGYSSKSYQELKSEELKDFAKLRCRINLYDTTNFIWVFSKVTKSAPVDRTNELMVQDFEKIKFDLTPKIKNLKMPISIISCHEDPGAFLIPDKQIAPQAEILWMNHCGHYPMFEQPDEFYRILMNAMKK